MAASVTSSVENINTKPPHARKKLPRASVGGLDGRIDLGAPSQRKKYVRHLSREKATNKLPHNEWIWTCHCTCSQKCLNSLMSQTRLKKVDLSMSRHGRSGDANYKGWERVKTSTITRGFLQSFFGYTTGSRRRRRKPFPDHP
jgi:hypothetical protein